MLAARGSTLPQTDIAVDKDGNPILDANGRIKKVPGAPYDVLSYEVKFIVTKGASINPVWTLATVAIDPSGNTFYAGQKVRTNDLTLTFGAVSTNETGQKIPSTALDQQHGATLIGRAVGDNVHIPQP